MIELKTTLPDRYALQSLTQLDPDSWWHVCVRITEPREGLNHCTGLGCDRDLNEAVRKAIDDAEYRWTHWQRGAGAKKEEAEQMLKELGL